MNNFEPMVKDGYEQLIFFHDRHTGLKAITCIHNTILGPALGGSRFWNYKTEDEAVVDVLRLARGMTYKNSICGNPYGGGKTVIIGDPKELRKSSVKTEAFWRTYGRYIDSLNGRHITGEDVGTNPQDFAYANMETKFVAGLIGRSGDPSPFTALGVYRSLLACCNFVYGSDSVSGKTVAVQGLGNVGYALCEHLHRDGAKLIVTDMDEEKVNKAVKNLGATKVAMDAIYDQSCDIYAPCALGATVNDETIPKLKCKIICGAANNVLKEAAVHGKALNDKGIVYATDYVANAGGAINVGHELVESGYNRETSLKDVNKLYDKMLEILNLSKETGRLTYQIADEMAEARIAAVQYSKSIYVRTCSGHGR